MAGVSNTPVPIGKIDLEKRARELGIDYFMPMVSSLNLGSKGPLIPATCIKKVQQYGYNHHGFPDFGFDPHDPACQIVPDPSSLIQLPWNSKIGWITGFVYFDGKPSERCPRRALIKQIEKMKEMGYIVKTGFEAEFMLFKKDSTSSADGPYMGGSMSYYDSQLVSNNSSLLMKIMDCLHQLKWDPYQAEREYVDGMYELNYGYTDALLSADRFIFYKFMAKSFAKEEGYRISFMPLSTSNGPAVSGCGLHINTSLWKASDNTIAMHDSSDPLGMSDVSRQFLAGVMKHLLGMTAIVCPTVNSFKRLHAEMYSIPFWGVDTKAAPLRVVKIGDKIDRYEFRLPDNSCNPYFAQAALLVAGLEGIQNKLEPDEKQRIEGDISKFSIPKGTTLFPKSQELALHHLEQDTFLVNALGDEIVEAFTRLKRHHLETYYKEITQYELNLCDVY